MSNLMTVPQTQVQTPGSETFQSRQEQARMACEAAGIVWPGTILPEGTALYESGVDKLKSDRAAWRRLPLASEVIGLVGAALAAEDRIDAEAVVRDLRLRKTDGRLIPASMLDVDTAPSAGLGYGPHTLRQLVQQIDPLDDAPRGFASALLYLSDRERAEILNKRLDHTKPETSVTLRTKLPHSGSSRVARAALSQRYGSVTDFDIAEAVAGVLKSGGDTSGRLDYKPGDNTSRFEVIWPSEIPVETFVVGDVHYACLSVTNSETGQGSLRIVPAVIRARCANLTLSTGEGIDETIRHIGDPKVLKLRLMKAIRRALDDLQPLLSVITQSAKIQLDEFDGGHSGWSPEKAIAAIAKRYELPKASVQPILDTFKKSAYPASVFGITSAISEAAHSLPTWTDEAGYEKIASEVQAKAVEVVRKGTPHALALEKALAIN